VIGSSGSGQGIVAGYFQYHNENSVAYNERSDY
jgi:hypothetical protein